jgi:hypothetical protein
MSDFLDDQRREAEQRVLLALRYLGALQHLVATPDAPDREARLAEAVEDLNIALFGDVVARAELEAHNAEGIRQILARVAEAAEAGEPRV